MNRVKFVYWWPGVGTDGEPVAFYQDGNGSDVTGETLQSRKQALPMTPTYQTWVELTARKLRCPKCWMAMRGLADMNRHRAMAHPAESKNMEAKS